MNKWALGISLAVVFSVSMILVQNAIADDDDEDGSHLTIVQSQYQVNPNGLGKLKIKVAGEIPTEGEAGAFGYGVVTGFSAAGPENVLAITTHMCASDHPFQDEEDDCSSTVGVLTQATLGGLINENHNDAEMHAHILDLMPITAASACAAVPAHIGLEVDILRTIEGLGLPGLPVPEVPAFPNNNLLAGTGLTGAPGGYDIDIDDNKLTVKRIPSADLFGTTTVAPGIVSFGIVPLATSAADPTFITNLCLTDGSTNPAPDDDDD